MGIFGLTTFSVEQRKKEIGIRKILGTSVLGIVGLFSKEYLRLVVIACIIASPIAYYVMHRWLQDFTYRITIQLWIFCLATLTAVLVAFLTVTVQSIRAAMTNPIETLRTE